MHVEPPPFRDNRLLQLMVVWLLLFWLAMAIEPLHRFDWFLENLLVFIYGILLVATYRRFRFSNRSYGFFTLFLTLHMIGAHYTYAEVPLGFWVQELFAFERNHYDRLAHFVYGLLSAYPFWEVLTRVAQARRAWAAFLTPGMILAFSAFYEMIEGVVAVVVSPETGAAYLGTQGDIWDAQHDMSLAFSGAALAMILIIRSEAR